MFGIRFLRRFKRNWGAEEYFVYHARYCFEQRRYVKTGDLAAGKQARAFALLPIFLSLERIPRNLLEASADLGASNLQSFRRVVLPLSLPGTATAATFVFVLAIGDFLTPQMVGGLSGFTFGRIIYSQFGTAFNWPFGSALSVILAVVVILAIAAGAKLGGRQRGAS